MMDGVHMLTIHLEAKKDFLLNVYNFSTSTGDRLEKKQNGGSDNVTRE